MDFVPNKVYKIMSSTHLKGNYHWLDPLSGYVDNTSPGPAIINKHFFSYSLRVVSIRFKLSMKTSPNPTDDPFSRHLTDESSLDRRVVTRPTSPHSTDESSLDCFVVTRPFCRHSAQSVLSQSLDSICAVALLDFSRSLARSLYSAQIDLSQSLRSLSPRGVDVSIQQQGLAEAYPYLTYHSWLHDESSRKQLARALAVTRLDLSRSLDADRSRAVTWLDLSRSLARSPHSTDESSLDRFVVIRPTSRHSTDESSLDRRVVTRPTSPHSTDESSLDRFVVTRPFCRHSAQSVLSQSLDSICAVAWLNLSRSLARSLYSAQIDLSQSLRSLSPRGVDVSIQQQGLDEAYPYLTYPSWLHDESSRKQLARALAVTRRRSFSRSHLARSLAVTRSLSLLGAERSLAVAQISLSSRIVTRPTSPHSTDESSLDRFVVIRSTSRHSTDKSSLDRRVVTRPTSRHSTDESSLDRRVVTRPTSRHSTDESSLDRRVVTRPTSRHSTDESSLDRRVVTRPTSLHSTDESSLDRFIVTRPFYRHSTVLSSLDRSVVTRSTSRHSTDESSLDRFVVTRPFCCHSAQSVLSPLSAQSLGSISRGHSTRSLAVTRLAPLRSLDSLPCGHSTRSLAVTRLVLRSHSARIALSQSLRLLASLEHDVISRRHVHP
ncbi:hypothetical protein YC2023_017062 [Brassica napus]